MSLDLFVVIHWSVLKLIARTDKTELSNGEAVFSTDETEFNTDET